MRWLVFVAALAVISPACGGHPPPPPRGVVEADLGAWKFRRFQALSEGEVYVQNNKSQAYTASYVSDTAERAGHVKDNDVVNVFVTRFEKDDGIVRETVRLVRRLAAEQGYQVDESKIGGARALTINGHGESWVIWPAQKHVVKVGGRGRDGVPAGLVGSYADRYPSDLPGGALEGALPPGPEDKPKTDDKTPYDSNNPTPDLDKYDPKKSQIPHNGSGSGSGS